MRADAMMLAQPEGKMRIRAAVDPELISISENSFVAIGAIEKQRYRPPGRDRLAAESDIFRRSTDAGPASSSATFPRWRYR